MRSAFILAVVVAATATGQTQAPGSQSEAQQSSLGYGSVQEALTALKDKPGAETLERDGWILVQDRESDSSLVLWSFAPSGYPAYPAVVKRRVFERDGSVRVEMNVLCEATKEACDQLVREFQELTERMREGFNSAR